MAMKPGPDMEHDAQLAAIYRAAAEAGPPAHLDDAIRAAARREVAAGPHRPGLRRWSVPLSLAAVLVLSVTVVTMMREQGADRPETMIPAPAESPAMNAERDSAQPPAAAVPEAAPQRRSAAPRTEAPPEPAAQAGNPAPEPRSRSPGDAAETERGVAAYGGESRAKAAADTGRAAEMAGDRHEDATAQRSAPAPLADARGGAGITAKPAAPAQLAAPVDSALWQDLVREPPEKWLQRIAELRRAGRPADARAVVAEFHRRFPDRSLPDELR